MAFLFSVGSGFHCLRNVSFTSKYTAQARMQTKLVTQMAAGRSAKSMASQQKARKATNDSRPICQKHGIWQWKPGMATNGSRPKRGQQSIIANRCVGRCCSPAAGEIAHLHITTTPSLFYGLANTVYIHRIWAYIWWFLCQKHRIHTIYVWLWPTLLILSTRKQPAVDV